ncbi:ATP-binding protein [Paenibacillus glycanilyticus]|uniref:ATP-binding protein n=1 Tax=Paenibacillus glycanilyticus TaxID=126569 RepID=UPI00203C8EF4|nr:ATP-binding protein [Paenibacillus glycanilyticus]MCM3628465.1 ATP-binding protein [Paenibacillus glycanilyticus]
MTNRIVVVTIGKTHSGKTTFAKQLELQLKNAVMIDQDNHASFINAYYESLRPKEGPNKLKYAVTQSIIDYAVNQTDCHIVLCNSNLARKGRMEVLNYFRSKGFIAILVYFDIPEDVLQIRVKESQRSKDIFRSGSTFEDVLARQLKNEISVPEKDEADYLYVVRSNEVDVPMIIEKITEINERIRQ